MSRVERLGVIFGVVLAITACTGEGNEGSDTTVDAATSIDSATSAPGENGATTAPGATGGTTDGETGSSGEVVVDVGASTVNNLDHIRYSTTLEKQINRMIYETLVGRDNDMSIVPELATEWSMADDQRTWTFKLRPDVTLHDGTPLNAEAVKFNLDRMIDPESASIGAPAFQAVIEAVEVVDAQTVEITTVGPNAGLLDTLTGWGGEIMSPTAVQEMGEEYNTQGGIGTGPFILESFEPGASLVVTANPDYWDGAPSLERVTVQPIAEVGSRVSALLSGQTDFAINVPASQLEALEAGGDLETVEYETTLMWFLGMNTAKPPLDDPLVRKAIAHAIDMETLNEVAAQGTMRPFDGPIQPLLFGYDDTVEGQEYDLERSQQLLDEAGVDTVQLDLFFISTPEFTRIGQLLQAQLSAAGINVEVNSTDTATYYSEISNGEQDLFISGWGNAEASPTSTMGALFSCTSSPFVAITQYCNEDFDRLVQESIAEFDDQARADLLSEAAQVFVEDAPVAQFWTPTIITVHDSQLQGFDPTPIGDFDAFRQVTSG